MPATIYQIFVKFFVSQLFGSCRQWMVFLLVAVFTVFGILFYSYLNNFHTVFIHSLKKVYPEIYINSHGRSIPPPEPGIAHRPEYFDISTYLIFKYSKDTNYKKIIDLGLRSISEENIKKVFCPGEEVENPGRTMWVNQSLWTCLSESGQFDGNGVWVKSRMAGGEDLYLNIQVFNFHGVKNWAVLPGSAMERLGRPFNITTVYPQKDICLADLKKRYRQKRMGIIEWTDRLPFFIRIVFLLSKRIYLVLMLSFSLLAMFMAAGILQDTMRELKIMIQFSSLYGAPGYKIYLFAVCCIFIYFGSIFFLGILGGWALSLVLSSAVPVLGFMRHLSRNVWELFWFIPAMCLMAVVYVYLVFNSKLKISE